MKNSFLLKRLRLAWDGHTSDDPEGQGNLVKYASSLIPKSMPSNCGAGWEIKRLRLPDREQPKLACKWPSLPHVSCQPRLSPFFQVRPVRSSCGIRRLSVAFDRSASRAAQRYQKDRPASGYDNVAIQRDRSQQKTFAVRWEQ